MKRKILYITIYCIVMIIFALFWGQNFSGFVTEKGDDFFGCLLFVVLLTYILLITLYLTKDGLNIFAVLTLPILIAILAFILDIILLGPLDIPGTPAQTTYIYTGTYGIFTLLAIKLIGRIKNRN